MFHNMGGLEKYFLHRNIFLAYMCLRECINEVSLLLLFFSLYEEIIQIPSIFFLGFLIKEMFCHRHVCKPAYVL